VGAGFLEQQVETRGIDRHRQLLSMLRRNMRDAPAGVNRPTGLAGVSWRGDPA
jgi:hypothetical protein